MGVLLEWPELVRVDAEPQSIWARFIAPHRTLATSEDAGGLREDVVAAYNHQSCEPNQHGGPAMDYLAAHAGDIHQLRCRERGFDPARVVSLGTAANMRNLGMAEASFRDLRLAAVCTAGVEGNAGRAGDVASWYETGGGFDYVGQVEQPQHGTIVTMLFSNQELTPGALTRLAMMVTEAKTAVLQDLVVGSRYSQGRATGTGTDQIMLACPMGATNPLTGAGQHVKVGELASRVVYDAIAQALSRQSLMTPSSRCSLVAQLGRFGVTQEFLISQARLLLASEDATVFCNNLDRLEADPHVVAAAAGLAEVADQIRVGVLPSSFGPEYAGWTGAVLAMAASGGVASVDALQQQLQPEVPGQFDVADTVARALCAGFAAKWAHLNPGN